MELWHRIMPKTAPDWTNRFGQLGTYFRNNKAMMQAVPGLDETYVIVIAWPQNIDAVSSEATSRCARELRTCNYNAKSGGAPESSGFAPDSSEMRSARSCCSRSCTRELRSIRMTRHKNSCPGASWFSSLARENIRASCIFSKIFFSK